MMPARGGEMSDTKLVRAGAEGEGKAREPYEAPRLTAVANARELLAGFEGPIADQGCPCPGHDFQPT
jgi:hypothetical protein